MGVQVNYHSTISPSSRDAALFSVIAANSSAVGNFRVGSKNSFSTKERCFPLPDYDLGTAQKVAVTVYGKVLDENYSRVLFDHSEFDLETVFLIDKVQKRIPLEKEQIKLLRRLGVIEGKAPYVYISAKVAEIIGEKAQYIKNRGFENQYYKNLIIDYLTQWGEGAKPDLVKLLNDKLPDVLDTKLDFRASSPKEK